MTVSPQATNEPSPSTDQQALTRLARGLKIDTERDSRGCPHNCSGSLELTEEDIVICGLCRCTPDGLYLAPERGHIEDRGSHIYPSYPRGSRRGNRLPHDSPERYYHSERVILPGGFDHVYDEDEDRRPIHVGEEYTFDVSTY